MTMYDMEIGGESLLGRTGAVVAEWAESPPEPVQRWIDVPGRQDGPIDASEAATGAPEYGRRRFDIRLLRIVDGSERAAVSWLTELRRWLHNRSLRFAVGWDPGYTYEGRFAVSENAAYDGVAEARLTVDCGPWKTKGERTYRVEASLGKTVVLRLGAPVVPTVTCDVPCLVNYMGETHAFGPGASRDPSLVLRGPEAYLTVNATPDHGTAAWSAYEGRSWADYGWARLAYLAGAGGPEMEPRAWGDEPFDGTWADVGGTWLDNAYRVAENPPRRDVFFTYEWKDL